MCPFTIVNLGLPSGCRMGWSFMGNSTRSCFALRSLMRLVACTSEKALWGLSRSSPPTFLMELELLD